MMRIQKQYLGSHVQNLAKEVTEIMVFSADYAWFI